MPKIFTAREKLILYITISIVCIGITFGFLIAPVLEKNEGLDKQIDLTRTKLKKFMRLLSQKEEIQNQAILSPATTSHQQKNSIIGPLSELKILASDADIRIIDIRPQNITKAAAPGTEIIIDLRTDGMMEGYIKFIYNIEKSLSLLRVKKLQLTAQPNSSSLEGNFCIYQTLVNE